MRTTKALPILLCLLLLIGFSVTPQVNLGPRETDTTTWAKMGTPGKVIDTREMEILVPDGLESDGKTQKWKKSRARLDGMMTIDEPTLEYYRKLDADTKKAKAAAAEK